MPNEKPYSASSDNNKAPILQILRTCFAKRHAVLEIGSGTGQHAVHFAPQLPHLIWHSSDRLPAHEGIKAWLRDFPASNIRGPVQFDVENDFASQLGANFSVDAVFSANTAHIMSWPAVCDMFEGVGKLLHAPGLFVLYGPFSDHGQHNSVGNRDFDQQLRARDPLMGIRDRHALEELAQRLDLDLIEQHAMPANNQMLIWQRQ